MVEGVDQGEGRCTIKRPAVIQGSCDAHRCLVDIRDTEVDFSHFGSLLGEQGAVSAILPEMRFTGEPPPRREDF